MGQQATGILYGCEVPELPTDEDNEGPDWDILDRWEKAKKINRYSIDKPRIRLENEGGKTLFGVWIAVGGSGEDGAHYFMEMCLPLSDVETAFAKRIKAAAKLWSKFAVWVAKHEKIVLPEPTLWLTPCETA